MGDQVRPWSSGTIIDDADETSLFCWGSRGDRSGDIGVNDVQGGDRASVGLGEWGSMELPQLAVFANPFSSSPLISQPSTLLLTDLMKE